MSADASVTFEWGDAEHKFRLAIGELRELQEKCNAGPPEIFFRLQANTWRVDDIREVIRLGLIGGGTTPIRALQLVGRYVDARPLMENVGAALSIVGAALVGVPDDQPKKEGLGETEQTDGSASPSFMGSEPPLAGQPGTLTS